VHVADGQTPPFLNPKSVSRYDGLYLVVRCHAAGTPEEETMAFFWIAGLN
jgi:hypothetical protein